MSLTNRLSLFSLTALALVLAGFSTALYVLAARHLHTQANQRLEAAMQTLVASTEIFPDHVEWEPLLRHITLGEDGGEEQVRWAVHTADGRLVDCSRNFEKIGDKSPRASEQGWRLIAARVRGGNFQPEPLDGWTAPRVGSFADVHPSGQAPGSVPLPTDRTNMDKELIMTVAVSERPIRETLHQLALWMGIISVVVWLLAALGGRWMCRRALAPVFRMADSARSLRRSASKTAILDVAPTRDELEDLGVAFNELLGDLRESLDRQQRFTGDASHQLRTPVAAMLASVDVALRQERSPAEYQRVLGVLRKRGGQLGQIIESLLFLARPEHASVLPEPECVDLGEWCRSWLNSWAEHPRNADLRLDFAADPIPVRTHPALLGQVLDNLIENACKYSEPGTPIRVGVAADANGFVLTIEDQGCGIEDCDRDRVFEPFFRSTQARWKGATGVGLGLTVARRLAGLLGGKLSVTSDFGKGSEFRLELPRNGEAVSDRQHGETTGGGKVIPVGEKPATLEDMAGVYKPSGDSADSTSNETRPKASVIARIGSLE